MGGMASTACGASKEDEWGDDMPVPQRIQVVGPTYDGCGDTTTPIYGKLIDQQHYPIGVYT
eukprot:6193549-Pleurochrysis_carterae.AAC.1